MTDTPFRIAILDDYQGVARDAADWASLGGDVEIAVFHDALADPAALAQRLAPFHALCLMRERTAMPAALIEALPNLRLLVTAGLKNASIDVEAARARGVMACGTPAPGHATAELTFGLMIAAARNLVNEVQSFQAGGWQIGLGRDLRGATLGVIGLGRLGGEVARIGLAFGMKVTAWSQNLDDARCAAVGAVSRAPDKRALLAASDFVTIHLRLSERSRGLIGAEDLAAMKRDAILINTSRAPIVDTTALVDALRAGRIGGAAIDVHDVEPAPADSPLRRCPRLIATPHIGYVTRETYAAFYPGMVEAIAAFRAGAPIRVL